MKVERDGGCGQAEGGGGEGQHGCMEGGGVGELKEVEGINMCVQGGVRSV